MGKYLNRLDIDKDVIDQIASETHRLLSEGQYLDVYFLYLHLDNSIEMNTVRKVLFAMGIDKDIRMVYVPTHNKESCQKHLMKIEEADSDNKEMPDQCPNCLDKIGWEDIEMDIVFSH